MIEVGNYTLELPVWILLISCILLAFVTTATVIPSIIQVSREKRLFDKPDQRKSHTAEIPTLGGVAVFLGILMPLILLGGSGFEHELKYIFIGLVILFFIGIKDDILELSAARKLILELLAISIIVIFGDIRITSFHGLMQIYHLPYIASFLFTVFLFVVIINGFNLIDGIDGLSAGVGIVTITSLAIWYIMIKEYSYAGFCLSLAGALSAFFYFNVFAKKNKIFLGDTGSLILGMIVSIFAIKFLETSLTETAGNIFEAAPSIAIALLIIPLLDTLRVFTLRALVGKSPFKPDRFHTHHKYLLLGFSHLKTTLILLVFNLMVIVIAITLRNLGNIKVLMVVIPASLALTSIPGLFFRYRVRRFLIRIDLLGNFSWILPVTFTNLLIKHSSWIKYKRSSYMPSPGNDPSGPKNRDLDRMLRDAYLEFEEKNGKGSKKTVNLKSTSDSLSGSGS